nr:hypothetical protein [Candidatus Sigynarchaeota archaeon]
MAQLSHDTNRAAISFDEDTLKSTPSITSLNSNLSSRKTRIGKSISPGAEKGLLEVTLFYKNKASFFRENVIINEFLPHNFTLIDSNKNCGGMLKDNGFVISWLIDKVEPDEEVEISYTIKANDEAASLKTAGCKGFK